MKFIDLPPSDYFLQLDYFEYGECEVFGHKSDIYVGDIACVRCSQYQGSKKNTLSKVVMITNIEHSSLNKKIDWHTKYEYETIWC